LNDVIKRDNLARFKVDGDKKASKTSKRINEDNFV
jgi:hypothetical protein